MKKQILFLAMVFVIGLVAIPNIHALSLDNSDGNAEVSIEHASGTVEYGTIKEAFALEKEEGIIKVKLLKNITVSTSEDARQEKDNEMEFDFAGHTITNVGTGYAISVWKGTVYIKDSSEDQSGGIISDNGLLICVAYEGSEVTIDGGTYTSNNTTVNPKIEAHNSAKLVIKNGIINGGNYAVGLFGDSTNLVVEGGKISSTLFAISGNGLTTTNSSIVIKGGTIESTDSAAIYQAQTGTTDITGGTIVGKIGIVARQGKVNITGGKVIANGTADETIVVGDAKKGEGKDVELQTGIAVVVDNTEDVYKDNALVTIENGTFETDVAPVLSYGKDANDISIEGGKFDQDVDPMYIVSGLKQDETGAIIDPNAKSEEGSEESKNKEKVPDTYDDVTLYLGLGLISVIGIAGIIYSSKKKKLFN